jgi:hypothetical protein
LAISIRQTPIVLALIIGAIGCGAGGPTISVKFEDVTVTARLKSVSHSQRGDFVYAVVEVTADRKTLKKANLDCVVLHVGSSVSKEITIDTLTDTLAYNFPAHEGKIYTPVIWDMRDFTTKSEADFRDATLVIDTTRLAPCFKLGSDPIS